MKTHPGATPSISAQEGAGGGAGGWRWKHQQDWFGLLDQATMLDSALRAAGMKEQTEFEKMRDEMCEMCPSLSYTQVSERECTSPHPNPRCCHDAVD